MFSRAKKKEKYRGKGELRKGSSRRKGREPRLDEEDRARQDEELEKLGKPKNLKERKEGESSEGKASDKGPGT